MAKEVREESVGDVYDTIVGEPARVAKGALVRDAIAALVENPCSQSVYVVGKGRRLLGAITTATLLRQMGYRLGSRKVGIIPFFRFLSEVFDEKVESFMDEAHGVRRETPLTDALKTMTDFKLDNLPVVDDKGVLVGELNGVEMLKEGLRLWKD